MKCLISLLLLSGCGVAPQVSIDPPLMPYYQLFMDAATDNGVKPEVEGLSMQLGDIVTNASETEKLIGECSLPSKHITIDRATWTAPHPESFRILLTYHELGHCTLYLPHVADQQAIMYPILDAPLHYYPEEAKGMIAELFSSYPH